MVKNFCPRIAHKNLQMVHFLMQAPDSKQIVLCMHILVIRETTKTLGKSRTND